MSLSNFLWGAGLMALVWHVVYMRRTYGWRGSLEAWGGVLMLPLVILAAALARKPKDYTKGRAEGKGA